MLRPIADIITMGIARRNKSYKKFAVNTKQLHNFVSDFTRDNINKVDSLIEESILSAMSRSERKAEINIRLISTSYCNSMNIRDEWERYFHSILSGRLLNRLKSHGYIVKTSGKDKEHLIIYWDKLDLIIETILPALGELIAVIIIGVICFFLGKYL